MKSLNKNALSPHLVPVLAIVVTGVHYENGLCTTEEGIVILV